MRIDVLYAAPVVILWPSSEHPVLVTSNYESVRWSPIKIYTSVPFPVIVDYVSYKTSFTVPGSGFEGKLYYFCENHEGMGIHEMFVYAADVIDIKRQNISTVVTVKILNAKSNSSVFWSRNMVLVTIFGFILISNISIFVVYQATAEKNVPEPQLIKPIGSISQYDKVSMVSS